MKLNIKISGIVLLLSVFTLQACKNDRLELGEAYSKLEGIHSNWALADVEIIDVASIAQKRLNIGTAFIGATPMQMDFNSEDFTYTVTPGSGPNYFGTGGSWAFDNNDYPTKITLTTNQGETLELPLAHTIRTIDPFLTFTYDRYCGNEEDPYISYEFKFTRTN
jgi:hypothetical protein